MTATEVQALSEPVSGRCRQGTYQGAAAHGALAGTARLARRVRGAVPRERHEDGKRYRSLGDADITSPVPSQARIIDEIIAELDTTKTPERSGRAMDHEFEDAFERLRVSGYL